MHQQQQIINANMPDDKIRPDQTVFCALLSYYLFPFACMFAQLACNWHLQHTSEHESCMLRLFALPCLALEAKGLQTVAKDYVTQQIQLPKTASHSRYSCQRLRYTAGLLEA